MKFLVVIAFLLSRFIYGNCDSQIDPFLRYKLSTHLNNQFTFPILYLNPEMGSPENMNPGFSKELIILMLNFPNGEWNRIRPIKDIDISWYLNEANTFLNKVKLLKNKYSDQKVQSLIDQLITGLQSDLDSAVSSFDTFALPSKKMALLEDFSKSFQSRFNDIILASHFKGDQFYIGKSFSEIVILFDAKFGKEILKRERKIPSEIDIFIYNNNGEHILIEAKSNRSLLVKKLIIDSISNGSMIRTPAIDHFLAKEIEKEKLDAVVQRKTIQQALKRVMMRDELSIFGKFKIYFIFRNAIDESFLKLMRATGINDVFFLNPDSRPFIGPQLDIAKDELEALSINR